MNFLAQEYESLPAEIHNYHSLCAIVDQSKIKISKIFGYASYIYKAISSIDGHAYILRRIGGI